MEESTNIEDEKSWKKYRPALASPASTDDYFLKSLAPDSVDVWKLVDASGNAKVRSKHVEESLSDLKHCPTDYTDWEYKSTQTGWKEADVKLICASDAKSMYSNALSFYRSQNVLDWSKFFVPDQKSIYILWQSQTFCARQKDDMHSVKLVFVPAQKFLKRH